MKNGNIQNKYHNLDNSVSYIESKSWPEMAKFYNDFSSKKYEASTEDLREENKLAIKEKFEFQCSDKSITFVFLQFLSIIRIFPGKSDYQHSEARLKFNCFETDTIHI